MWEFKKVFKTDKALDLKTLLVVVVIYVLGLSIRSIQAVFGG